LLHLPWLDLHGRTHGELIPGAGHGPASYSPDDGHTDAGDTAGHTDIGHVVVGHIFAGNSVGHGGSGHTAGSGQTGGHSSFLHSQCVAHSQFGSPPQKLLHVWQLQPVINRPTVSNVARIVFLTFMILPPNFSICYCFPKLHYHGRIPMGFFSSHIHIFNKTSFSMVTGQQERFRGWFFYL